MTQQLQIREPETTRADDRELLARAAEIAKLLQDAARLGYSLVLQPEQMKLLIRILEEAGLAKNSEKGFGAWPATEVR